jgi:hypothetical protein
MSHMNQEAGFYQDFTLHGEALYFALATFRAASLG